MDYEKLYKEANKKVAVRFGSNVAKELFPDLYESENERIRKEMLDFFNGFYNNKMPKAVDVSPWIAWLEKQGEQKSINDLTPQKAMDIAVAKCFDEQKPAWSEDDETKIKSIIALLKSPALCAMDGNKGIIDESIKYLKSIKDRVQPQHKEWNEEDEKAINDIMCIIEAYRKNGFNETHIQIADNSENWLKSLSPQSTWKPSDEQMDVLLSEVTAWTKGCPKQIVLESLYNDLKKLKG